jgi:hypothetical protein
MKRISSELLIGGVLTAVGVLLLLQNLGFFGSAEDLIWATLFSVGGIAFISVVVQNPTRWWALIPGAALLSLGLLIGLTLMAPALGAAWGGTIFLGGLGIGFMAIYLLRSSHWWALIPGGVLLTLGLVAGLGGRLPDSLSGSLFFTGLALTFGLVAVAPSDTNRRWALIPAGALLALAAVTAANTPLVVNIVWPALLILAGLALLFRTLINKEKVGHEDKIISQPH